MEVKAESKYIRVSPYKARRVIDLVRGKMVEEAEAILENLPHKSAYFILKCLRSAKANAEHNYGLRAERLYISQAYVNEGPRWKRISPRARGRADIIQKRNSHIVIYVKEKEE
ncbi:MAG TPA: 50S ribosomal protein L22 [Dictyoglomaceae bacterium]|nr:50S ribosomal protein L22 [Dictyoglomaceae bacterium]HOL38832.1 50S ribosomal protein L22 [Dictyoglomaceae bacterium]HOP94464.1 50S ribosomal protein L22 [Dictyoglomaceae bacterium]HPP15420.1 50S ribosomal protein L22 [Dictyoglomaceae bacterium]HPU43196.1 50S ribosomal protein L22 [Dictyoglomaceae bacterium]